MIPVYLGIGSNIDSESNIRQCAEHIRYIWPNAIFSKVYLTKAQDKEHQEDFLNAVVKIEVENKSPEEIIKRTQQIENRLRKNPPYPKGPRTIDIDLLLYNEKKITIGNFKIPHKAIQWWRFFVEPLCELLNPATLHPTVNIPIIDLLEKTKEQPCTETDIVL